MKRLKKTAGDNVTEKQILELKNNLEGLRESLQNTIYEATKIQRQADKIGGEIGRVIGGQLQSYFIGTLNNFDSGEYQPGSISRFIKLLDDFLQEWNETEEES